MIIIFFLAVNLITSPGFLWFIFPVYAALWWPVSVFMARGKTIRIYSLIMSLFSLGYIALLNYLTVPAEPWFLYIAFPLLLWPAVMHTGRHAARLPFAIAGSLIGLGTYLVLNIFVPPGHPWFLYLALPLLWWPITIAIKKVASNLMFLFVSVTIFMIYYGFLNIFISPGHAWSLYLLYPYAWISHSYVLWKKKDCIGTSNRRNCYYRGVLFSTKPDTDSKYNLGSVPDICNSMVSY